MVMMMTRISPIAMQATLRSKVHPGFAVDFMRRTDIFSSELIYVKPKSLDMILCSGPVKTERDGNENIKGEISARIRTASNMFSGAAVVAPCAYPNSAGGNLATLRNGRPRIAIDSITRSRAGTLNKWSADTWLEKAEKRVIVDTLAEVERARMDMAYRGDAAKADEAYVAIVRPVDVPTEKAKPYMGLPRFLAAPLPGAVGTPFQQFYESGAQSCNVYMSNLGAVYNQMYTVNNSKVDTADGSFRVETTCYTSAVVPVADVTMALEDAFNFSPNSLNILTDNEDGCVGHFVTPEMYRGRGKLEINNFSLAQRREGLVTASNLNITGRSGYCSPLTHFTDENFARVADEKKFNSSGSVHVGDGLQTFVVFSPFHIGSKVGSQLAGKDQFPAILSY